MIVDAREINEVEKKGVEVKTNFFMNMFWFLTFVNVNVHNVAFSASQDLDVELGNIIPVCSDSSTFA